MAGCAKNGEEGELVEVFFPGTEVLIKFTECRGYIVSVLLSKSDVLYGIAYFENGSYSKAQLKDFQFIVVIKKVHTMKIGFNDEHTGVSLKVGFDDV